MLSTRKQATCRGDRDERPQAKLTNRRLWSDSLPIPRTAPAPSAPRFTRAEGPRGLLVARWQMERGPSLNRVRQPRVRLADSAAVFRWYRGQDSNLHVLRTVAPKATASTNSATPALSSALSSAWSSLLSFPTRVNPKPGSPFHKPRPTAALIPSQTSTTLRVLSAVRLRAIRHRPWKNEW